MYIVYFIGLCLMFVVSLYTLKKLEAKKVIPIVNNPYTGMKEYKFLADIIRLYIFVGIGIVFLVLMNWKITLGFFILIVGQIILMYSQIRESKKPKERAEVHFSEEDKQEWRDFFLKEENHVKRGKIKEVDKIILVDDILYFSKREKIPLRDKLYYYVYLSKVEKKDDLVIFKYGAAGSPMLKRYVYVPKNKKNEMGILLEKINVEKLKKQNFSI